LNRERTQFIFISETHPTTTNVGETVAETTESSTSTYVPTLQTTPMANWSCVCVKNDTDTYDSGNGRLRVVYSGKAAMRAKRAISVDYTLRKLSAFVSCAFVVLHLRLHERN